MNQTNKVKDLYTKNYKIIMNVKKTQTNIKVPCVHEELTLSKCPCYPKLPIDSM